MQTKYTKIAKRDFPLISSVSCIADKKCKFFDENILSEKIKLYINQVILKKTIFCREINLELHIYEQGKRLYE